MSITHPYGRAPSCRFSDGTLMSALGLHEISQWRFGATSIKPTGLMTLRMPRFLGDLYAHADPQAERPTAPAIGVDADGRFRTVGSGA